MTASSAGTNPTAKPRDAAAAPTKPQRPATLTFTQAVLGLQGLAVLFATLVTWGLSRTDLVTVSAGWIWGSGILLMVLLFYVTGRQTKRWGRIAGSVLQAPMIVAGLVVPAIAVIGVMFLALWITGLRLGGRIDRERGEREAQRVAGDEARAAADGEGAGTAR